MLYFIMQSLNPRATKNLVTKVTTFEKKFSVKKKGKPKVEFFYSFFYAYGGKVSLIIILDRCSKIF